MKNVLLPLAPGFEEIEALTVADILRRGGVNLILAGTVNGPIEGRSKIRVLADIPLSEVDIDSLDMIVLPGGQPGTNNLKNDPTIQKIVKTLHDKGKLTAAICAAPLVLSAVGLLNGKKITSHPSTRDQLTMTDYSEDRVVIDHNIITSRAPGTAMEFAMKLLEILCGKDVRDKVNEGVMALL